VVAELCQPHVDQDKENEAENRVDANITPVIVQQGLQRFTCRIANAWIV